ncbi:MAG TPA: hypothetical protein VHY34_07550 [Caulobacteraceae bacterium]|jgi:hypothetical protein|nr:hypothetical protein [Caulobacteraceae bacterium]
MEIALPLNYAEAPDVDRRGISCTSKGLTLAGVSLLRRTQAGLAPRPAGEIGILMKRAYGLAVDPAKLTPRLEVIAHALNGGDLGRAMVAAVQLRLPALSEKGAANIARADSALAKYDPGEPRDARGRWTTSGGSRQDSARAPQSTSGVGLGALKPILVSNTGVANSNLAEHVCEVAGRHCEITALQDKSGRTRYFSLCAAAEATCKTVLLASRLRPDQELGVIFLTRLLSEL